MSGDSASVKQGTSKEEATVLVRREQAALGEKLGNRPSRELTVNNLRMFWSQRRFVLRMTGYALLASLLIAILIPSRYLLFTGSVPPESPSGLGMGLLSA